MAIKTEYKSIKVQLGQTKAANLKNTKNKTDELYANDIDLETQVADLEAALQTAGKVDTVSVNGGTPIQPDANKNVNLSITKGTVGLGNVTNDNANTLISTHNGNSSAHTDIRSAVSEVEALATEAKTIAEGRARAVSFKDVTTMIAGMNAAAKTDYKVGDNIFIQQQDVSDFWVAEVHDTSIIGPVPPSLDNVAVKLGYFVLCKLETQKVDLTDINAHMANNFNPHGVTKCQVGLGSVVDKGMDASPTAGSENYVKSGGVAAALAEKEPAFTKKTAFNKDFGTALPEMDGTASAGTGDTVARGNHKHPSDTTRVPTTRKVAGKPLSADVTLSSLVIAGKTYNGSAAVTIPNGDIMPVAYMFTESSWVASNNVDYGYYMLALGVLQIFMVVDADNVERDVQIVGGAVYSDVKFGGKAKYFSREA